ncbi:cyclodeaminase/cyclohydrolase family protein [Microbacterium sp. E-13]|uniref:cyclodeaminase/cyclohydrolase family protein n=1 Tax=Microbacterium sp. E-13 TaxID=3404048 RepID=UPI003CEA7345
MTADDIDPSETTLEEWLDRLAEPHGAPGGGAACGVMTAIAAALLGMVASYTPDEPRARDAVRRLHEHRRAATEAAEDDGVRSAAFGAALAMDESPERERAIREATVEAIRSSLAIGVIAASLVGEARRLAEVSNPHVEADLKVALGALGAALDGVLVTARSDLATLTKHDDAGGSVGSSIRQQESTVAEVASARDSLRRLVAERTQRE